MRQTKSFLPEEMTKYWRLQTLCRKYPLRQMVRIRENKAVKNKLKVCYYGNFFENWRHEIIILYFQTEQYLLPSIIQYTHFQDISKLSYWKQLKLVN